MKRGVRRAAPYEEDLVSHWQLVVHTEALNMSTDSWRVTGK